MIELQEEIDKSTITVGDFNNTLSEMDRSSRQKINKDIVDLNITINQLDIVNIYRLLHSTTADYTFSSNLHGTFTKTDHILGLKTYLNKLERMEIIQSLLSEHNGIKLEINNRKRAGKSPNTWKLSNSFLNYKWAEEEILREI